MSTHRVEMWKTAVPVNPELRADETACRAFLDAAKSDALEACVSQGHRVVRAPEVHWLEPNPLAETETEREWPLAVIAIGVLGEEVTE